MAELIECKTMFSNGTEYEWFLEHNCFRCTRFRKGYCRTYRMTEKARWDEKYFPYDDLMDYKGYAGKKCKRFTEEKPVKKWHRHEIEGQISMEEVANEGI